MYEDPTGRYKGKNYDPDYARKYYNNKQGSSQRERSPGGYGGGRGGQGPYYDPRMSASPYGGHGPRGGGPVRDARFDPVHGSGGGGRGHESMSGAPLDSYHSPSSSFGGPYSNHISAPSGFDNSRDHPAYYNSPYRSQQGHQSPYTPQQRPHMNHKDPRLRQGAEPERMDAQAYRTNGSPQDFPRQQTQEGRPMAQLRGVSNSTAPNALAPDDQPSQAAAAHSTPSPKNQSSSSQHLPSTAPNPPAESPGELSSLEKLKLFRAQVEASRQPRETPAESITRVAETFLASVATPTEAYEDTMKKQDTATSTTTDPEAPTAGGGTVNGDNLKATVPKEQLLKEKLRLKLAQKAAAASEPSPIIKESPAPSPRAHVPPLREETRQEEPPSPAARPSQPQVAPSPSAPLTNGQSKESARQTYAQAARDRADARAKTRASTHRPRSPSPPPRRAPSPPRRAPSPPRPAPTPPRRAPPSPPRSQRYQSPSPPPVRERERRESINRRIDIEPPRSVADDHSAEDRMLVRYEERQPASYAARPEASPQTATTGLELVHVNRNVVPAAPPAVAIATPTTAWVVRTLQLLKAQILELEKLVDPAALAAAESMAPVIHQAPPVVATEVAEPLRYEHHAISPRSHVTTISHSFPEERRPNYGEPSPYYKEPRQEPRQEPYQDPYRASEYKHTAYQEHSRETDFHQYPTRPPNRYDEGYGKASKPYSKPSYQPYPKYEDRGGPSRGGYRGGGRGGTSNQYQGRRPNTDEGYYRQERPY